MLLEFESLRLRQLFLLFDFKSEEYQMTWYSLFFYLNDRSFSFLLLFRDLLKKSL